ncbi:DUF2065 family protein [Vibrio sp. SM6]|uniref:DUF2065 family protein n=1 Tax=Vibrio agarilyticus TaxID=2726741 RepID=A0A7X8YIK8_9VIBR|nr:DUF2065 family protein [Vibrio agarilyticus]NLS14681.1 DUF2065 family protein [Vibrio agarilyticus]
MMENIAFIIGCVLIIEGVGPLVLPKQWRSAIREISQQPDVRLRRYGGALVVAGAVTIWMFMPK